MDQRTSRKSDKQTRIIHSHKVKWSEGHSQKTTLELNAIKHDEGRNQKQVVIIIGS